MNTNRVKAGLCQEIPERSARIVRTLKGDIAVFKTAEGRIFALYDRCPHQGGPLSKGTVHGEEVTCPLHGTVIDLTTGQAVPPGEGCARKVPVELVGKEIYLILPED